MEETSDVCFRDLSHLPNMHEPGHCTATLLEDVGGDWSLSGKTVLPDFPEPHLAAIDTTTTASLPAVELSEKAGSKSSVPHPLVTVPLLSTLMIEANHDQAEMKQHLPPTQPAAQLQWSLLCWHLRGELESSMVPLRQAQAVKEYIRSATNTNEAQATDTGSICGIGSHQKVSQLQKAGQGEVAGSVNVVRSLLDRQLDCCHPQASGYGVVELTPDSPDVKLKTHTQWAHN